MTISKYNASHSNMVINNDKRYAHYTLVKDSLNANLYTPKFKNLRDQFDIIQANFTILS